MIFWILIAITALTVVGIIVAVVNDRWSDWYDALVLILITLVVGGILSFGIPVIIGSLITPHNLHDLKVGETTTTEETLSLTALGNDTETQGRHSGIFFINSGYVDEEPVINYIVNDNGWNKIKQIDAEKANIAQGTPAEAATVTHRTTKAHVWWLAPGSIEVYEGYYFHIPEGSITSDFSVDISSAS